MRTANGVLCMQLRAAKRKNANHKALPLRGSPFSGCPLISQGRPRPLRFCFVARPACMRSRFWRGAEQDLISRGRPRPLRGTPSEPPPSHQELGAICQVFSRFALQILCFSRENQWFFDFFIVPKNFAICTKFFPSARQLRDLHRVFFPRFVSLCSVTLQPRRMTPVLTFMRTG